MNIHELDSYDLGDAVKFNDKLNPRIWGADEKMRPEVREQLLRIADDFREFLGIDVEIQDITVSGSNAAYTYTPHSDIDLHLVVDLPEADRNEVYRELFDAKKYAYNDMHDIQIGGYDVELYVQDANKTHHSQGIYSIMNNDWVSVPKRRRPDIDDISVKSKFEDLGHRIELAIATGDYEKISAMAEKIREYRQAGLDAHGEFGPENLAFKILRTQGLIKKLYDARSAAKDELLSLDERKKKKKKVRYGYGGYWYPGTAYAGQDHPAGTEGGDGGGGDGGGESMQEDVGMTWDGVNPTTDMFTSEDAGMTPSGVSPTTAMFTTETDDNTDEEILRDFVDFCVKELKIEQMPRVKLRRDPQWPSMHRTFGRYNDETKTLEVAWGQRHIMDVLRTVAHELTHKHQHEREGDRMGPDAGETGSPYENEANARAGVLMRDYGRLHPEYFSVGQAHDLEEANPAQQLSLYKPDGTTYRGEKMPGYDPDDFHSDTNPRKRIDRLTHRDLSNRTATDLVDPIERAEQNIDKERLKDAIRASMSSLTSRETAVLNMRFWKDLTLAQTAKALNSSPERIRQIEAKALRKLRHESRSDRLEPFVKEGASGYIPTKAQAKDPRYSMALTVDIKPGQVGKEANKLKLKTDRQGTPQIARANGLFENLFLEYQQFKKKAKEDYSPDEPPGPEFKPTMPAGTLRVDVSDVYDWYKLGQHISDLEGLGQHDFGQGPPSAIVSFGDEDLEHKFIKNIKATGLDVTDIDPKDVKKRPGKKIKTDPTYNVDEAIDAPVSKSQDAEQYYRFILAKAKMGRPLTRGEQDYVKMYQMYRQQKLAEFAPDPNRGNDESQGPDYIEQLANRWWNAADPVKQDRIAAVLRSFGYAISQVESEDDAVQLTDVKSGHTYFISADDFDPDLFESVELDEVNMSPGALEKFAASKEAQGIRAGFEAELIFRDTQGESDEQDPEPDYDADERAYSISQVIEFFDNDEYGYGLSSRERNRLEEQLDETYMLWRDEQMMDEFRNEAEDLVRKVIEDEEWDWDDAVRNQLDDMGLSNDEIEEAMRVGRKAGRFNSSKEQEAYAKENPGYQRYLEAYSAAESILDDLVEESVKEQDKYWDAAMDDFRDNWSGDDDSFFSDVGLRWMSDIANEYNLSWPVWNMSNGGNNGNRDWDEIGAELQQIVGMPVKVSSNYHSTPRKEGQWIIEPDGSLDPDDKSDEAGLEIVSPPMPLLMAIAKLKEVTDWANDPNGGNAYTNSSTGLHMGVSLPIRGGDVDYVKLILFMGDKYVLDTFGREANSFTASALGKLQQNIKGGKSDPAGVVELLRHGLTELAFKELQKGVGTSKYTSAHLQNGYIEFRSPGGDWLAKADEEIGILENTMMRFARAMQIAGDPGADRQEYAKKLYKLVTADNEQYTDQLRLFSQFAAGELSAEQLKKRWAEKAIGTERKTNQRWKLYDRATGEPVPGQEYNGYTEEEARARAKGKISPGSSDRDFDSAYELRNIGQEQQWEVYAVDTGKTLEIVQGRNKGEVADTVFDKYANQGIGFNVRPYQDPATMTPRAKLAKRITTKKPEPQQVVNQATNERGVPYWEIYSIKDDWNVIHTFLSDTAADAKVDGANWLTSTGVKYPDRFAVRAKMVPNPQAADAKRDSVDLQRRLGVQDVEPNIAQNFNQPQQDQITYEIYRRNAGNPSALHRFQAATHPEAMAELERFRQSHPDTAPNEFALRNLPTNESIDPISGAGAVPPRQDPKSISKKTVTPAEKVFKNPVKGQPYRSAIGQAISQKDLENMTQQIQVARRLGDSVMEMEETPPAVLHALDQAAQKNSYKNWADVKANPRSPQAVMTVAKLASTILRTTGPHHEKLFYKNKTDVDENFADGKVKGKSRPGRVKRAGASCNGSVTDLRARAKRASGEKAKMYHWCANMKSGRKK